MKARRDSHADWRELIAARLDRPLTRAELRGLNGHLKSCASCGQIERDYREQRQLLHALPPRIPPRDLWARTSAALDREVVRGSFRGSRLARGMPLEIGLGPARRTSSAALVTTLAALGVVAALGVMQLMPGPLAPTAPGRATPFAVDPQPLAFIGNEAADVYVYQTQVGHVCPQSAPDCEVDEGIVRTPVDLPASMRTRDVALSPTGHQLALVGSSVDRGMIAVVMLPDEDPGGPGSRPGPGTPTGPAEPDTRPTEPPPASQPTVPETPGSGTPVPSSDTAPSPAATSTAPPASAVPGLRVLAILEDVQSAGAPPAWSPSGAMLAFSAMPRDGSHGPDVYVWAPDDARARQVTDDHGSYFASWSGDRIVISRPTPGEPPTVTTAVIDPTTGEERSVDGPQMWLPVVNPAGSHAIAWSGLLDLDSGLAVPRAGMLYRVEWAELDPFGDAPPASPSAEPPSLTPASSDGAATSAPTEIASTPTPEAEASPRPSASSPAATSPAPSGEPSTTDQPLPPVADGMVALDLGRDPISAPVVDWQVRWSTDGHVLGVWVADAAGSTWGRLAVLAIDPDTQHVSVGEPLLSPTLARRGFTLGLSRVAWVAPSEDNADGELRIRTWGDDGVGGLRFQPPRLEEVLPAF